MKFFLLLFLALVSSSAIAQPEYRISSEELMPGIYDDPVSPPGDPEYISTVVDKFTYRKGGVIYHHLNRIFNVPNAGWLTQFNYAPVPIPFGIAGTNSDSFLFQGTTNIDGIDGVIVFDTVYFNNGAGNLMDITNYNKGFFEPDELFYGQPSGGITVAAMLHFNNGITTTNRARTVNGAIVFSNNALYTGGLTDEQHVDGFVSEVNYDFDGNPQPTGHGGDFTFPVGNSSSVYQLRRQGDFTDNEHTLTVGWIDGNPNTTNDPTGTGGIHPTTPGFLGTGINSVTTIGFWDWHFQDITDPTFNALSMPDPQIITVSIPSFEYLSGSGLNASDLKLVGWDLQTSKWINLSGASGASSLAKGSTLVGTIPANVRISALAVGSTSAILPVTFVSFTVKADGCKSLLQWQTGSEQNNNYFLVERSSNGNDFTSIARVSGAGNSSSLLTYNYKDESPLTGANYYRITQVDFDGTKKSTEIKVIRIQCDGNAVALRAYPNPAKDQVNVQTGKALIQVNLLSSNGQTVLKYIPSRNQGGTFSMNIQHLQNGIYFLQMINKDGTTEVIKLLKQQ